jgi:hypothetical protein
MPRLMRLRVAGTGTAPPRECSPTLPTRFVEVSAGRSSGAPAEAPERMSLRAQVPYNV